MFLFLVWVLYLFAVCSGSLAVSLGTVPLCFTSFSLLTVCEGDCCPACSTTPLTMGIRIISSSRQQTQCRTQATLYTYPHPLGISPWNRFPGVAVGRKVYVIFILIKVARLLFKKKYFLLLPPALSLQSPLQQCILFLIYCQIYIHIYMYVCVYIICMGVYIKHVYGMYIHKICFTYI